MERSGWWLILIWHWVGSCKDVLWFVAGPRRILRVCVVVLCADISQRYLSLALSGDRCPLPDLGVGGFPRVCFGVRALTLVRDICLAHSG